MEHSSEQPLGFFAAWKATDLWFEASESEKNAFMRELRSINEDAKAEGVRMHGVFDCSWSSEWTYFTFWECPNLEVLERTINRLKEIGDINKYNIQRHFVGRRLPIDLVQ